MKNYTGSVLMSVTISLFTLVSCGQKELTHDEKLNQITEDYIENLLKDEEIQSYSIDSVEINDITQKKLLEIKALKYESQSNEALKKAKELGVKFKNTRELVNFIEENEGQSSSSNVGRASMQEMKKKADSLMKETAEKFELAKKTAQEWMVADSVSIVYYEVVARGSIVSTKNIEKPVTFPFHISKDYTILKEPEELLKMPR